MNIKNRKNYGEKNQDNRKKREGNKILRVRGGVEDIHKTGQKKLDDYIVDAKMARIVESEEKRAPA